MRRSIIWREQASETLEAIKRRNPALAERLHKHIEAFGETGRGDFRKLEGRGDRWRLRIGDWRVVFLFHPPGALTILTIANRRDAYR